MSIVTSSLHANSKFALLTCLLPVLATERSKVLEKMVKETKVSKTVLTKKEKKLLFCAIRLDLHVDFGG